MKHSKYAPSLENRYGLYKVTKYYPGPGKSGFIVRRFVLKRNGPTLAACWNQGENLIIQLGLEIYLF